MQTIVPSATIGSRVRMGQKVGVLGKEGGSGGWAYLHYDIKAVQPSGRWGCKFLAGISDQIIAFPMRCRTSWRP